MNDPTFAAYADRHAQAAGESGQEGAGKTGVFDLGGIDGLIPGCCSFDQRPFVHTDGNGLRRGRVVHQTTAEADRKSKRASLIPEDANDGQRGRG